MSTHYSNLLLVTAQFVKVILLIRAFDATRDF